MFVFKAMCISAAVVTPTPPSLITLLPMIFHPWLLSSILHGKIPQSWRKKGGEGTKNQECGQSPISFSATPTLHLPPKNICHIAHKMHLPQPVCSCEEVEKCFSVAIGLFLKGKMESVLFFVMGFGLLMGSESVEHDT